MITIEKALNLPAPLFIDLRSPCEYEEAHIPGAINIPLFENEERALLGKVYKEKSSDEAYYKGLEITAPKLPEIYRKIKPYCGQRDIVLYCWRGGMRSRAISGILDLLQLPHYRLTGGFKAFRQYVNRYFEGPFKQEIVVLYGLTGAGKTDILRELNRRGYPAVDLEGLANHRGSVFGHVGMGKSPTQKQFEGLLFAECWKHREAGMIAVECESRRIGPVFLPAGFFAAMQAGRKVLIYDSMDNRIKRLVAAYTASFSPDNEEQLTTALNKLRKRLGNSETDELIRLVRKRDYYQAVNRLNVLYYDPLYKFPDKPSPDYELNIDAGNLENAVQVLAGLLSGK